ncbi:induced during hyphae development protein 1-like [Anguilla anguilla]|uniref:induced during hyphae development protein 1-like n=1 Tax=Anguilla anguilla TaxID=7936 RepID=UPI0015ABD75F|nr:induced during hyphae development protein 1-like [Anguilla anguilla]
MALRHVLWTLLLCNVLTCSICGVQKVSSYGAVQYQSAVGRPEPPSRPRPRSHARATAFQPGTAVKGGGAPYSPLSQENQQSRVLHDQREDVQRHAVAARGEAAPVIREQVKLIPVFHGRPDPNAARSQVIQFGSAQTGSASRVVDQLLSGYSPAGGGGGGTLGGVNSHVPAQRRPGHSRLTIFGSRQSTGTSYGSHYNSASTGPGHVTSEMVVRRDQDLPARYLATGHFTPGGDALHKPTSTPYVNANAAEGSFFSGQRIPHEPAQILNAANLGTRYSGTSHYGENVNAAHLGTRYSGTRRYGENVNTAHLDTRYSGTRRYIQSLNTASSSVLKVPGGHEAGSRAGSSETGHRTYTQDRNVASGSEVKFPTRTVQFMPGGAAPSSSWGSSSRFDASLVRPDTSSTGSVKGGSGSASHRQGSSTGSVSHRQESSTGSVKGGSGSASHRQDSSQHSYSRPAE